MVNKRKSKHLFICFINTFIMKKIVLSVWSVFAYCTSAMSQSTTTLNVYLPNSFIGYSTNNPLEIRTNNIPRAYFSTNQSLTGINPPGDGLLIKNQQPASSGPGAGEIAIFTSPNFTNGTEVRMGLSGNLAGRDNRLELWGNYAGLFYNASTGAGVHKFAQQHTVYGFLGTNHYWRIGTQTDAANLNAERRLHVVDNAIQFRLSYSGPSSNGNDYTDFLSNPQGNLQIMPTGGRVGINLNSNPTANLDVNRNERIWNVKT